MNIRPDFDHSTCQLAQEHEWVPSPQAGVERIMLDRAGDEVAVATSIVRYAPDSHFPQHTHAKGEEFIVLSGEFADEHGRYPPGSYVRNPPGSHHSPFSDPGCDIWVKLRQFDDQDLVQSVQSINMQTPATGVELDELFNRDGEVVSVARAAANVRVVFPSNFYTRELLVLSGSVTWQQATTRLLEPRSWIRLQPGHPMRVVTQEPSVLFTKTRPRFANR